MNDEGLSNTTIALMTATALFYDTLQWFMAFIFMDWLVGFFAFLTFYLWFRMKGLKFNTFKRVGTMSSAFFIEIIPFLASLPAWTLSIVILAMDSKLKNSAFIGNVANLRLAKSVLPSKPDEVRTAVAPKVVDIRLQNEGRGGASKRLHQHIGDPEVIRQMRQDTAFGPSLGRSGADPQVQKNMEKKFGGVVAHRYDPVSQDRFENLMLMKNTRIEESQKAKERWLSGKDPQYRKRYEKVEKQIKQEFIDLHRETGNR
ncbi:MAG: hypothetical protein AAB641_01350 [Patescibacteria group bacterium]